MSTVHVNREGNYAIVNYSKAVVNLIPHCKEVEGEGGQKFLVIPTRKEELQLLRNLGYDAPSPLSLDYDWCGVTPFDAQVATTDLLVHHTRAYVLNDMGCFDADTEYLTRNGWVRFGSGYDGGEVAQYDQETGVVSFVKPYEYVKLPCDTMIEFKHKRGLDQVLSPEHRMILYSDNSPDKMEVVDAATVYRRAVGWADKVKQKNSAACVGIKSARIPTVFTAHTGSTIGVTAEKVRVMVAVIADGYFPNKSHTCVIRLKKERKQYRLRHLLNMAGIPFTEKPCKPAGFIRFSFTAPWVEKEFTLNRWMRCNEREREVVADEVMHWDGHVKGKRQQFCSSSKASADFVQFVFSSLGYTTSLADHKRRRRGRVEHSYVVTPTQRKGVGIVGLKVRNSRRSANARLVPSPDGFKYCFRVPSEALIVRRGGRISGSGNTGKTLSALFAFDYLKKHKLANKMLVVAPLSTLTCVWLAEVFERMPHLHARILWNPISAKRREALADMNVDIYIINHDGLKILREDLLIRPDIDTVVIDELAVFRNKSTQRWKAMRDVIANRHYVWGLTGSPTPREPTDAWAQIQLLTPGNTTKSMRAFKQKTMMQVAQYKWVPLHDANEVVFSQMQPSVRYTREDCVDLPPTTHSQRTGILSAEQQKVYTQLANDAYTAFAVGEVTPANEGVAVSKLLQVASGFVYTDDQQVVNLRPTQRLSLVEELVESTSNKVLVFATFKKAVDMVEAYLLHKGFDVAKVYGDTSKKARDEIFFKFQKTQDIKIIVAHAATMAHGLTLTAADTIIWYGPTMSLELYEQANARITRPGQRNHTHIIHISGTPVEERLYKRLRERGETQGVLLELFKEQTGAIDGKTYVNRAYG